MARTVRTESHRSVQPREAIAGEATAKLAALLAEMQALLRVLPHAEPAKSAGAGRAELVAQAEEAAVEDGFDNMPL